MMDIQQANFIARHFIRFDPLNQSQNGIMPCWIWQCVPDFRTLQR